MFSVSKWLKHPSVFEDDDGNVILSKSHDLTKTGEDKFFSTEDCCKISINAMIDDKIKKKIKHKNKTWTRSDNDKCKHAD